MHLLGRPAVAFFLLLLLPLTALAQLDGGVGAALAPLASDPTALALPADPGDLGAWFKLLYAAVMGKNWWLLASLGIVFVVSAVRRWVPEKTKVGIWLRGKLGGLITNFTSTFGSGLAVMLLAGQPFSVDLLFKALGIALAAAGGWSVFKTIREAIVEKKAAEDGKAAASNPGPTLNG